MLAPLIVQSNGVVLLELGSSSSNEARQALIRFAELEKSPEHVHTYRITPLSLWNAAESGISYSWIVAQLQRYSRYQVPDSLLDYSREIYQRHGCLKLRPHEPDYLCLEANSDELYQLLQRQRQLAKILTPLGQRRFSLPLLQRGNVKVQLIRLGYPVNDLVPLHPGSALHFSLRATTRAGSALLPRAYQRDAVAAMLGDGSQGSGFGAILLPCGAGKTLVGLMLMTELQYETLVLVPSNSAAEQWRREILDKTTLTEQECVLYNSAQKVLAPVTVVTYQMLTWRAQKMDDFQHLQLFAARHWGLVIYDEVHLLPAPVFRFVAELQSLRRLGLSGTLIREDGQEDVVFALIGPKRYDVPWREMERDGWIARVNCHEIRLPLPPEQRLEYALAPVRQQVRLAAENPQKDEKIAQLLALYPRHQILIIGQYLSQLERVSRRFQLPLLTGKTVNSVREQLYQQFRQGDIRVLVVSKVANCAIDLPDANMAIQLSGSFGSRQEEAQRLGRLLRPKEEEVLFFSLISRHTVEEDYAAKRRTFLLEQGYHYDVDFEDE